MHAGTLTLPVVQKRPLNITSCVVIYWTKAITAGPAIWRSRGLGPHVLWGIWFRALAKFVDVLLCIRSDYASSNKSGVVFKTVE